MNIPNTALSAQEEDLLAKAQLTSLYNLNRQIFDALVLSTYADFGNSPAAKLSDPNAFVAFVDAVRWSMQEAFTQRPIIDPPKRLSNAIWKHLENRGIVVGYPQDAVGDERINRIYFAFACFVTVRCFGNGVAAVTPQGALGAAAILKDVENKGRALQPVGTIPNPTLDDP